MAITLYPPGPKNPPFIGHLSAFRKSPINFLRKMASEYGDIVFFKLGNQRIFLLNDPGYIKDVLVTHQNNFTKSRMLKRSKILLGEGLLTSEGQFHVRQRRLVQPAFHRQRLAGYGSVMVECAARTRDRWQRSWPQGGTADVAEEMMRLTLSIVGKTLFSADVEADAKEIGESLTAILQMFDLLMLPFSELLDKLPIPAGRRFQKARDRLDAVIYGLIRERRAAAEDRGDLLSMLLLAQDEEGNSGGMTDAQVRDEALTIFLAGHETTANALTWTWYLLSQHPEVELKLHQEIDMVLAGRLPSYEDLPTLAFTEKIFAESMRLYPPAWAIGRLAIEEYKIGPYLVPAGSIVITSPWVTQRDARYFPEPDRFYPERWTPEAPETRPKFSYFPFGGGARVCIGDRFAWMEGILLIATLAQRWQFRLVPGHRVEPLALITLRTKYGMRMEVIPRQIVSS